MYHSAVMGPDGENSYYAGSDGNDGMGTTGGWSDPSTNVFRAN